MTKGKRKTRLLLLRKYIYGCILVNGRLYTFARANQGDSSLFSDQSAYVRLE